MSTARLLWSCRAGATRVRNYPCTCWYGGFRDHANVRLLHTAPCHRIKLVKIRQIRSSRGQPPIVDSESKSPSNADRTRPSCRFQRVCVCGGDSVLSPAAVCAVRAAAATSLSSSPSPPIQCSKKKQEQGLFPCIQFRQITTHTAVWRGSAGRHPAGYGVHTALCRSAQQRPIQMRCAVKWWAEEEKNNKRSIVNYIYTHNSISSEMILHEQTHTHTHIRSSFAARFLLLHCCCGPQWERLACHELSRAGAPCIRPFTAVDGDLSRFRQETPLNARGGGKSCMNGSERLHFLREKSDTKWSHCPVGGWWAHSCVCVSFFYCDGVCGKTRPPLIYCTLSFLPERPNASNTCHSANINNTT